MLRAPVIILVLSSAMLHAQHGIVVAATGGPSPIGVIDTSTNTPALTLPLTGDFSSLAVTSDGASAYFVDLDPSKVFLINLSTGETEATIFIPSTGISAIALSPSGSKLFMVGVGGAASTLQVFIVDTSSNTVTKSASLKGGENTWSGYQIAVSTDGSKLFVPSTANPDDLYIVSTATLQIEHTIHLQNSVASLAVTPDALFVGESGTQASVASIDLTGSGLNKTFLLAGSACTGQIAVDDQRKVLYASGTGCGASGKKIYAIDVATGGLLVAVRSIATLLALSPDGNTLYAGQAGGIAALATATLDQTAYIPQPGVVQFIALTPDGASLIAINSSSALFFYTDPVTGAPVSTFPTGPLSALGTINAAATCNAGETEYVSDTTGNLAVFDNTKLAPAAYAYLPTGLGSGLFACQFEGGPLAVFAAGTNTIAALALDGVTLGEHIVSGSHFSQLAATPDGSKAFMSEQSGSPQTVQVFNFPGLEAGGSIPITAGSPYPIAFSPNSAHTYIGTYSVPTASIIDVDTFTNAINRTISLPDPLATSITVSPDGKTLFVLANVNMDVVDLATESVTTYPVAFSAYHIPYLSAISLDGTKIHIVENGEDYVLSVFDTASKTITSRIKYPGPLSGVAFTQY